MDALLRLIRTRALRRGRSGDTAWLMVAAAAWLAARARRHDDVIYRTKLEPGERLVVEVSPPRTGRRGG